MCQITIQVEVTSQTAGSMASLAAHKEGLRTRQWWLVLINCNLYICSTGYLAACLQYKLTVHEPLIILSIYYTLAA